MDRQQQAAATQLLTHAQTLGLPLPKPVLEAYARVEKVRAGMGSIAAHNLTGVAAAVADALGRDADPTTDPEVAQAIALNVITGPGVLVHVEEASFSRLLEACDHAQDEIVAAFRKPFDQAAATLALAHERIGDLDLTKDSEAILKKGGDIAAVWAEAVEATKLIDAVVVSWVVLGQIIHPEPIDRRWLNLRIVNPTAGEWDRADLGLRQITAWDAVRVGMELSLPTLSEYTERRAAIVKQRAKIQAAASAEATKRPSYLY